MIFIILIWWRCLPTVPTYRKGETEPIALAAYVKAHKVPHDTGSWSWANGQYDTQEHLFWDAPVTSLFGGQHEHHKNTTSTRHPDSHQRRVCRV